MSETPSKPKSQRQLDLESVWPCLGDDYNDLVEAPIKNIFQGHESRARSNRDTADLMRRLADQVEDDQLEWEVSYGGSDHPMHTIKLIPRAWLILTNRTT